MSDHVLVRMYDVGFGDCFLLEFPTGNRRPFRVLVDCGAHTAGYPRDGWRPEDVVDQIIEDCGGDDAHVEVVVATHRHQDHVSGFRSPRWSEVRVGDVWMPWTEHPTNRAARSVRRRQERLALGLESALAVRAAADPTDSQTSALVAMVTNSLTNERAMKTLHGGFKGRPNHQFLASKDPSVIEPEGCPGLVVHVLGPSRDESVIRDMDPPAGQSYLRFCDGRADAASRRPFRRPFEFAEEAFVAQWPALRLDDAVKEAASSLTRDDDVAAAVGLDKAVNGTSLMLMFEFGDAFLLFPGDAQWGTWRAALDGPETRRLIERTTFLKIGHHGSHNATPKELFEQVLPGRRLWGAAASVRSIERWPQIPKLELMEQIAVSAERVRRSDAPGESAAGVRVRENIAVEFEVPC